MYFSTHVPYVFPSYKARRNPVIILSILVTGSHPLRVFDVVLTINPTGKIFPVVESYGSPDRLLRLPIQDCRQSHFVCTTKSGEISPLESVKEKKCYNEIIIGRSEQVRRFSTSQTVASHFLELTRARRWCPSTSSFWTTSTTRRSRSTKSYPSDILTQRRRTGDTLA